MTTPPPTRAELARKLYLLSCEIADAGVEMEYVGGFGNTGTRGRALIEGAQVIAQWAIDLRAQIDQVDQEKEGQ